MKLVVGLGNPGKEYEKTKHNIGFLTLDYFAKKYDFEITKKKFESFVGEAIINNQKIIFLKQKINELEK